MPKQLATLLTILGFALAAGAVRAYELETVAEGLDRPWCVAFLPGGDLLVTERPGRLKRVRPGGSVTTISGVPPVYFAASGQSGLFDVLPDPDFVSTGTLYLVYAHGDRSANATRVARARLVGEALEDLEVIFTVEPMKRLPQHYGGKLIFLPDGTLLLTTGDGFNYRESAQDTSSLLGKTVRIRTDGSIPEDNPFADGMSGHPAVWTYGHRNPQGLVLDPVSGRVYQHEHGPRGGDELNVIEPGVNYGWPAITYGLDYSGAYVSPFTEHPEMAQPAKYWVPSIAPSGLAIYYGAQFPEWNGSLLVGALVDREVRRLTLKDKGIIEEEALFTEIGSRIRDVRVAADGSIYLLTDGEGGRIIRVHASPSP
ncbi:MAG TPA: PQQ-dependent sugar dehydrogenase [Pseudomonadales bacterium]